jgi:hypothetical protein
MVVNETAAQEMFGGNTICQSVEMFNGQKEVVGIVADVKHEALHVGSANEAYFPIAQFWAFGALDMLVRSKLPVDVLATSVGDAIRAVDPQVPIDDFWTMDSVVEASVSPRRFTLRFLGAFAVSTFLLARLGIYGVLSYSVIERIPEIGIRMALGESAAGARRTVVSKTITLALLGVALGTTVSLL